MSLSGHDSRELPIRYGVETATLGLPPDRRGGRPEPQLWGVETPTEDVGGPTVPRAIREVVIPAEWSRLGYQLVEQLPARGGQAILWRAENSRSESVVVRRSHRFDQDETQRMTLTALRALAHTNVLRAVEPAVEIDRDRWELLEYCRQGSLARIQAGRATDRGERLDPLPIATIEEVVRDMAAALRYLHREMLFVHADVKPDNILWGEGGRWVLTDFNSAVRAAQRVDADRSGLTPAYAPPDPVVTPAWDWAQLGFVVLTMALGERRPAFNYPRIDYGSFDQRISRLVQGLLVREPDQRWGYRQVDDWLRGEDVPITGSGPAEFRQSPFFAQLWEVPCASPEETGRVLAERWTESVRLIQGPSPEPAGPGEIWLTWLGTRLEDGGDGRAGEVRRLATVLLGDGTAASRAIHVDRVLAALIVCLNPGGVPRYWVSPARTIELTRHGLRGLIAAATREEDDLRDREAEACIDRLYQLHLLAAYQGAAESDWLAALDDEWHVAFEESRILLRRAADGAARSRQAHQDALARAGLPPEQLLELQRGDWELFAHGEDDGYASRVRAHLLGALVSAEHAELLAAESARVAAEVRDTEPWFVTIGGADSARQRHAHRVRPRRFRERIGTIFGRNERN